MTEFAANFNFKQNAIDEGYGNAVIADTQDKYGLEIFMFDDPAYGEWIEATEEAAAEEELDELTAYARHRWSSYTLAMLCKIESLNDVPVPQIGSGCCFGEDEEGAGGFCSVWATDFQGKPEVIHVNLDGTAAAEAVGSDLRLPTNDPSKVISGINAFATWEDTDEVFDPATTFVGIKTQPFKSDDDIEPEITDVWDMRFEKGMSVVGYIYANNPDLPVEDRWLEGSISLENGASAVFQVSTAVVLAIMAVAAF